MIRNTVIADHKASLVRNEFIFIGNILQEMKAKAYGGAMKELAGDTYNYYDIGKPATSIMDLRVTVVDNMSSELYSVTAYGYYLPMSLDIEYTSHNYLIRSERYPNRDFVRDLIDVFETWFEIEYASGKDTKPDFSECMKREYKRRLETFR